MSALIAPNRRLFGMENTYPDGNHSIDPDSSREWSATASKKETEVTRIHKDAHGNVLNDGDTITVIKDLKFKGSLLVIKCDTKIKKYSPDVWRP